MPLGIYERHPKPILERLWSHIDKNGPIPLAHPELGPCWIWLGYRNKKGYGVMSIGRRRTGLCHRILYVQLYGEIPQKMEIDHICCNRACQNPSHIRLATHSQNLYNQKISPKNKTGLKGVYKRNDKWVATITTDRQYELGHFNTPEDAHEAYREAAKKFYGEFANFG